MFEIKLTEGAVEDLMAFSRFEQERIVAALATMEAVDPAVETEGRKRLHPGQPAEWEMRVDNTRIFYDVDSGNEAIKVGCIGKVFYTTALPSFQTRENEMHLRGGKINLDDQCEPWGADDFDAELEMTRATSPLIALIKERAAQPGVVSLRDVRKQLLL
jgi:mRNA-degrading endonuclease RelE of RelBE toxin-antitoxin system